VQIENFIFPIFIFQLFRTFFGRKNITFHLEARTLRTRCPNLRIGAAIAERKWVITIHQQHSITRHCEQSASAIAVTIRKLRHMPRRSMWPAIGALHELYRRRYFPQEMPVLKAGNEVESNYG